MHEIADTMPALITQAWYRRFSVEWIRRDSELLNNDGASFLLLEISNQFEVPVFING